MFCIVFICEKVLCQGIEVLLHYRRVPVSQVSCWLAVTPYVRLAPLYGYISEGILHVDRGGIETEMFLQKINRGDFAERHQWLLRRFRHIGCHVYKC